MTRTVSERLQTRLYPNARYRQIPYDLVRELTLACLGIGVLVAVLAGIFSTPDVPMLSAQQVARQDPLLLVQTELRELGGQSSIATYGPPYNHSDQALQGIGGLSPQSWAGVQIPIDTAQVDVIRPLSRVASVDPAIRATLQAWNAGSVTQQARWIANTEKVLVASSIQNGRVMLPMHTTEYGPVPAMADDYLRLAQTGLLEAAIDGENGPSPIVNRTRSLLLLEGQADTAYATKLNMLGGEWGVIKETGNYPGAVWLWYYTLLYQIPPYNASPAADLLVVLSVIIVTFILVFVPFIPGLRSIPRHVGIYKLIWRRHYRDMRKGVSPYETSDGPA